jgi:hypothetical protein
MGSGCNHSFLSTYTGVFEMSEAYTRNVRFWVYHNGSFVKLTLRPEQTIEFGTGGETEEGFSCSSESYHYDARRGVITCDCDSWGRDCDGRHSSHWGGSCVVGDEQRHELHDDNDTPVHRYWGPRWREESRDQRDMTAEAMGY